MWYCNQLCAGISHITARSFSSAWNYCLKRGVSLWTEVGCEGLGSVYGTTLSAERKKKIIWLSKNLSVCVQVSCWLTALSMTYYLTPPITVGEEKDTTTGLGLDLRHVSIWTFFKSCSHLCLWLYTITWLAVNLTGVLHALWVNE